MPVYLGFVHDETMVLEGSLRSLKSLRMEKDKFSNAWSSFTQGSDPGSTGETLPYSSRDLMAIISKQRCVDRKTKDEI